MVKFLAWGGVDQELAEVPDRDNIRWNNTTLSSSVGTCFSDEVWEWPWGKIERSERSGRGIQSKWSIQIVRILCFQPFEPGAPGPHGIVGIKGACRHDVKGGSSRR